jgi:hypothetical protein
MRKLCLVSLSAMGLIALAGCTEGTPGGPGATHGVTRTSSHRQAEEPFTPPKPASEPSRRVEVTQKQTAAAYRGEQTFTLSVPTFSTTLKQGEAKTITIGMHRGKNFAEDVALHFTGLTKGVTVEPANPMIRASDKDATITVKAADGAPLGDFTVKAIGHPTTGADAMNEFKITIRKK